MIFFTLCGPGHHRCVVIPLVRLILNESVQTNVCYVVSFRDITKSVQVQHRTATLRLCLTLRMHALVSHTRLYSNHSPTPLSVICQLYSAEGLIIATRRGCSTERGEVYGNREAGWGEKRGGRAGGGACS